MTKFIGRFFLLLPFILKALNIQNIVAKFYSESAAQLIAYLSYALIVFGGFLYLKDRGKLPHIIKLWLWFYLFYWTFGLLANIVHDYPFSILKNTIPLAYFISFSFFLSIKENQEITRKVIGVTFFISSLMVIIFQYLNFSMDHDGIYKYALERAGGVYGDANNASLVCLITFIFLYYFYKPSHNFQRITKILLIAISLYAFFLTFSKTGFLVLLIILGLMNHKWFNAKRILFTIITIPILLYYFYQFSIESEFLSLQQKSRIETLVNILTFQYQEVEYSGRDFLLKNMLNFVYENPILGNGIDFSTDIRGHNTIIGVWADAGIFTFIFFLIILFRQFWLSFKSEGEHRYFLLSTITVLTVFMISLQTIITEPYLMVVFAWIGYQMSIEYKPL